MDRSAPAIRKRSCRNKAAPPQAQDTVHSGPPVLEAPTSQGATMKAHRSTQVRVSNQPQNSNFEAGTALENLRAEIIDIEALARAAEAAADALPSPRTTSSACCSAGSSRSSPRRPSRRARRSALPTRRFMHSRRRWRHAGARRGTEPKQLPARHRAPSTPSPEIRNESNHPEGSIRAGRRTVSGPSWSDLSASAGQSQGRPRGLPSMAELLAPMMVVPRRLFGRHERNARCRRPL